MLSFCMERCIYGVIVFAHPTVGKVSVVNGIAAIPRAHVAKYLRPKIFVIGRIEEKTKPVPCPNHFQLQMLDIHDHLVQKVADFVNGQCGFPWGTMDIFPIVFIAAGIVPDLRILRSPWEILRERSVLVFHFALLSLSISSSATYSTMWSSMRRFCC